MGDLINRSALYKAISVNEKGQRIPEYDCDNFPITLSLKEFKEIIKKQPTVEAEPVVHCKECKSFMEYTKEYALSVEGADGDCYIKIMNSDDKQFCSCKYDDFCSYGAKIDEGV